MEAINKLIESKGEAVKFALVGVSGIFVNFIVLFLLDNLTDLAVEIIFAMGIIVSMTTNYVFNRIWTFDSKKSVLPEYFRFLVFNSIGGLIQWFVSVSINNAINKKTVSLLIISINTIYVASAIGIGIAFVFNFITSKFLVFNMENLNEGNKMTEKMDIN